MMRPDLMPRVDVQHVGGAPIFVMNRVMTPTGEHIDSRGQQAPDDELIS
jgi:hypothetical protein